MTTGLDIHPTIMAKAMLALERRFGKSMLPFRFSFSKETGRTRCIDPETGSWVEFYLTDPRRRIKIIAEHNGLKL